MAERFRLPVEALLDTDVNALAGGSITFYTTLTTALKTIYTNDAKTIPANNPLTLDSVGQHGDVFLDSGDYRLIVKNAVGSIVPGGDIDPIHGGASSSGVAISSYATIAAMTALSKSALTAGQQISVGGYATANDGGGGTFYWDAASSAAADGGTVFEADDGGTGRWKRVFSDTINVRWFGATGDGTTDDTGEFVAALATGRSVFVPFGIYKVTTNSLFLSSGQMLYSDQMGNPAGIGAPSSGIKSFSATGSILTIGGTATLQQNMCVRDISIWFDDSVARSSGQRTIRVSNAAFFDLHRVDMFNGLVNFSAEDCLIYSLNECVTRNGEVNVDLVPTAAYYPTHNLVQFNRCRILGATVQAVRANGAGALSFNQVVFSDCQIESNGTNGSGLPVVGFFNVGTDGVATGVSFYNNWFEGNRGTRDIQVSCANTYTGVVAIGNSFRSTQLTSAHMAIENGYVTIFNNGMNAAGPTYSLDFGVGTQGIALANVVLVPINNLGSVITNVAQYTYRTIHNTLVPAGSTTPGSPTHTTLAYVSKNGQRVTVDFECEVTNLSTMAGDFRLTGLPYTSVGSAIAAGYGVVSQFQGINLAAGGTNVSVRVSPNVTYASVQYSIDAGSSKFLPIAELTAPVTISGSFSYDAAV